MQNTSCLQKIRASLSILTAAEKKVADHILQTPDSVAGMSIGELSELCQSSKSAVVRFCKTLGYDGYTQLKLALVADLSKHKQLNYAPYIYPHDTASTIMEKVFSSNVKALHDTAEHLDSAILDQVLNEIHQARHIYLFGVGTSASMITELQYRLMLLGYTAQAFIDPGTMKIATMNIGSEDLAFGISYSGRTVATAQALQLASQAGAKTICITSHPNSPISERCDYSIFAYSDEVQFPVEAMSAKIAQLSLIYAITTALSARHYEDTLQRAKRTRELIDTIRMEDRK